MPRGCCICRKNGESRNRTTQKGIDTHVSECCFLTITLRQEKATHNITPRTPHKNQRVRYPHTSYTQVPPRGASTNARENAALKSPMYCPRLSTELRLAT